ncbi:hypothetical protein ACI2K4_22315 [Micromonospora sp. NPDC050397]|uniref:hypothetical protein n=1 Tax=Micromonospora sp. NPDC050397 TaxID=3364279 RepID=UPI00384E0D4C
MNIQRTAYHGLERMSDRVTAKAVRSGVVLIGGVRYAYNFDPRVPGYHFSDPEGNHVVTVLGKRISRVKVNFREYMGE